MQVLLSNTKSNSSLKKLVEPASRKTITKNVSKLEQNRCNPSQTYFQKKPTVYVIKHRQQKNSRGCLLELLQFADNISLDIADEIGRFGLAPDVSRMDFIDRQRFRDRILDQLSVLVESQIVQHIHRRAQESGRISDIFAHHTRASVTSSRFEYSVFISNIDARNQSGSAD